MRIVDMQRRLRERGRIRLGYSTPGKREGIKVPHKLDTFRFTAADQATVEQVAACYGGTPEPWPGGADQWQVTTEARQVPVVFATEVSFSQSYEQWSGGFLRRICDGVDAMVPSTGRRFAKEDCACDPDDRTCQMTTHLKLILPELPGLGAWRLVTHGRNAAEELLAAVELIEGALGAGLVRVPARLLIEKREKRRLQVQDDGSTKPVTLKFAVPVLELEGSVAALGPGTPTAGSATLGPGVAAALAPTEARVALPATARPAPSGWKPVEQQALPEAPTVPMRERLDAGSGEPKKRRNSPPELPSTGRQPRTADQADNAEGCSVCGQSLAGGTVVRNPDPGGSKYIHRACSPDSDPGGDVGDDPAAGGPPRSGDGDEVGSAPMSPSPPNGGAGAGDAPPPAPPPAAKKRAASAAAKKAAAGAGTRMMSHNQHATVMAITAKVWPKLEGEDVEAANHRRRALVLGLCAVLGQPGLESRTGITASTAGPLIDTLKGLEEQRLAFEGGQLVDRSTGEPVAWERP